MTTLWQWLLQQGFLKTIVEALLKHGVLVVVLFGLLVYTEMQRHRTAAELTQQIQQTRTDVVSCQNEILRMYREDRQQTLEVLQENTEVMRQVRLALER